MLAFIADDDPALRRLMSRICVQLGWSVMPFEGGEEMVEAARQFKPELVICEMDLPGAISGLDVCFAIHVLLPQSKIILMTGDAIRAPLSSEWGFAPLLRKPFRIEQA